MKFFYIFFFYLIWINFYLSRSDSLKFYLKKATELTNNNHKKSIYFAFKALHLAKLKKDTFSALKAYLNLADAYWYADQYKIAMDYYFKVLQSTDSLKFPEIYAYALYGIGWIQCAQRGNIDKLHYLQRSLNIYKKLNNIQMTLASLNGIAGLYNKVYQIDTSQIQYLDKSIELTRNCIRIAENNSLYADELKYNLTFFYIQKKYTDSAEFLLNSVLKDNPNLFYIKLLKLNLFYQKKKI